MVYILPPPAPSREDKHHNLLKVRSLIVPLWRGQGGGYDSPSLPTEPYQVLVKTNTALSAIRFGKNLTAPLSPR
jgi:hypothetical protein